MLGLLCSALPAPLPSGQTHASENGRVITCSDSGIFRSAVIFSRNEMPLLISVGGSCKPTSLEHRMTCIQATKKRET